MLIKSTPDTWARLAQMSAATRFEPAGDQPHSERTRVRHAGDGRYQSRSLEECVTQVATPRGEKPVLKTMVTTACERNCFYCPFRAGRAKTERITIKPDEIAKAFDAMQRVKMVDGLFLSSGIIKGSVTTQDKLLDTVEIVRRRYQYRGYIHLKVMPGIEADQLLRAMQLADRVSVNLEAPTPARLHALAPKKAFERELLSLLSLAERFRRERPHEKLASTVTQFVVGAVGDTDLELLALTEKLHRHARLARAYYSAFHPVEDTPFENMQPTLPQREFRLYQSSFLLRDYGWSVEELPFTESGNLPLEIDPKRAWAEANLRHAPVELMTADREQLMRVPGIGPKSAAVILQARRQRRITDLAHLRQLHIRGIEQAAPFILLDGRRPSQQLPLF